MKIEIRALGRQYSFVSVYFGDLVVGYLLFPRERPVEGSPEIEGLHLVFEVVVGPADGESGKEIYGVRMAALVTRERDLYPIYGQYISPQFDKELQKHPDQHFQVTKNGVVDLFDVDLTQGELDGLRGFLMRQIGKPYDTRGVLHFVTRRPERWQDQEKWFCSELIHAGFVYIRKPLLVRIPAWKVYPGMLTYSPLLKKAGRIVVGQQSRAPATPAFVGAATAGRQGRRGPGDEA